MNVTKPPPTNHTVRRLLALKPGEAFIFYRGNLGEDIKSSKGASGYAALLTEIAAAAHELEAAGRIMVRERTIRLTKEGQRFTVMNIARSAWQSRATTKILGAANRKTPPAA